MRTLEVRNVSVSENFANILNEWSVNYDLQMNWLVSMRKFTLEKLKL